MTPKIRAFFLGALAGILALVCDRVFHVVSPLLNAVLVPGSFITLPYQGENPWTTGVFVVLLEFAFNFLIYGLAGLALGWLIDSAGRRRR